MDVGQLLPRDFQHDRKIHRDQTTPRLVDLIQKLIGEADNTSIGDKLKHNASLGVNLLRLVNSAAMDLTTISVLRQLPLLPVM